MIDGDAAWRERLTKILNEGIHVSPRDYATRELLHPPPLVLDMARPIVTTKKRKLNYSFMCAEALWILSGSNELEPLTRFVPKMEEFSDDGRTLFGAYGPPVIDQLPYVICKLLRDRDTRQAALTIWRQKPPLSKDIPCTIAMTFVIRNDKLHQHVFMRSSDIWLGVPYDMFSFACIGLFVACHHNKALGIERLAVTPGELAISMTSSHLYERDEAAAWKILETPTPQPIEPVPSDIVRSGDWKSIQEDIVLQREKEESTVWRIRP